MSAGGERTEKATPKRRQDERKKGNVMQSRDLTVAIQLLGLFVLLRIAAPWIGSQLRLLMQGQLSTGMKVSQTMGITEVMLTYRQVVITGILALTPIMAVAAGFSLAVHVIQTRFLITTQGLAVKPERINPVSGFKRLFSSRSTAELVKAMLKVAVIVVAVQGTFRNNLEHVANLIQYPAALAVPMIVRQVSDLGLRSAAALLVLSVFDLVYQWWRHEKDLRMTKQEVKDEYKRSEGDPQVRGRIRQIQRLMATRRMMQDVPKSSVVVTNPTHFAVALRYEPGRDRAPVVLAKGQDLIARRIREIARENQVTIIENPPLARTLHATCKIGQQIPADLFGAVAEVLAAVARIKEGRA